jgi:hypothetical protein
MSDDDQMETRLRRALNSEAAMVQPAGDGLQKIRGGVDARRRGARWRNPAVALVAAAILGLAVGGLVFGLGLRGKDDGATVATQTDSPTPTNTPSTSPSPSQTSSPPANGADQVYVYYVHDDGQSPRLYRELHTAVGAGSPSKAALRAMLAGQPADPDYSTPWDNTKLLSYRVDADTATVDLSNFVALGAAAEQAAVQEIVYTVTANDPALKKVQLRVNGKAPKGHRDWSGPIRRAPLADVQGWIWILAPTQGATVSSPVTIDGYGTAFEATISWEVRKNGAVVAQGTAQGGSNGEFGDFHDTVALPPGSYDLSAFEVSAKDGSAVHIDTKSFTVK